MIFFNIFKLLVFGVRPRRRPSTSQCHGLPPMGGAAEGVTAPF